MQELFHVQSNEADVGQEMKGNEAVRYNEPNFLSKTFYETLNWLKTS